MPPLTRALPRSPAPLALDVNPLARLLPGGALELLGAAFPPTGEAWLVLWRPGAEPAFALVRARVLRVGRAWRAEGAGASGWVVLWEGAVGAWAKGS